MPPAASAQAELQGFVVCARERGWAPPSALLHARPNKLSFHLSLTMGSAGLGHHRNTYQSDSNAILRQGSGPGPAGVSDRNSSLDMGLYYSDFPGGTFRLPATLYCRIHGPLRTCA